MYGSKLRIRQGWMDGVTGGGKGANFMGFGIVTVNFIPTHLVIHIRFKVVSKTHWHTNKPDNMQGRMDKDRYICNYVYKFSKTKLGGHVSFKIT